MNSRLLSLRKEIARSRLDAVLISSLANIIYFTNFAGFSKDEREAYLFIVNNKQYILIDGRYSEAVRRQIKNFELLEISAKFAFENAMKHLAKKHEIKSFGIEEDNLTVKEHKTISKHFNDINHYSIRNQRITKDQKEVAAIEKACKLADKTFHYILDKIKAGVSEKQLAFEIEFFIKKQGGDISFHPIVAFGRNSSIPHHVPTNNKLTNNKIVLLDFGAKVNNYCSDMTRTVFFGSASAEYKKMYQTVRAAQQKAIEAITSDGGRLSLRSHDSSEVEPTEIKAKNIDKIARAYIISKGYPTIPHSLGHGIGIDVHESPLLSPKSKDILKPGMVFTIEPGIYIPGFGGVRIEDVVVLEKTGLSLLTYSPKQIIEL